MRNDGEATIYQIQHQNNVHEWVGSNFDHFGTPEGFKASDKCWQETGIQGTYDEEQGINGVAELANKHRGTTFRLIKRFYVQKTSEVYICGYK
jgi:hypothetical protein